MIHDFVLVAICALAAFFVWKLKLLWSGSSKATYSTSGLEKIRAGAPRDSEPEQGTNQAEDEANLGRVLYESLGVAEGGTWAKWESLSQKTRTSFKLAAQSVIDATTPMIHNEAPIQELCACGHFEIAHALSAPYPCQAGAIAPRSHTIAGVKKEIPGRPSTCGCPGYEKAVGEKIATQKAAS